MATIGTISAALQLVDKKKENLRKAFQDLQSQSHFLSSFNLTWSDLDSHFSSLHSSLHHKFNLLQSLSPEQHPSITLPAELKSQSPGEQRPSATVPARPELKALCETMDGVGLLRYLVEHRQDRIAINLELPDAYKSATDVAAMVFNAMGKFYSTDTDLDLDYMRRNCVGMLEDLMGIKPEVSPQLREKAMKLALHWNKRIRKIPAEDKPLAILGFLHLVAVYNLDGFDMDELIDYVIAIIKRRQAVYLCRAVISADRISDLIQKLIDNDNKLVAVRFSYEFKMTDKFPLVPLLKEYRRESSNLFMKLRNNGKASLRVLNEANSKEISSLRSIIKCIEDYHLESDYPKDNLLSLVEKLEKEKTIKKRKAPLPKPGNPKTSKVPRIARHEIIPKSGPNFFQFPKAQAQAAGLLSDVSSQYVNQTGPYVMAGPSHAVAYMGFGNPTSTGPNLYPSEVHTTGRPLGFNGSNYVYPSELHSIGGSLGFNGNPTSIGPNLYPSEAHSTGGPLGFNGNSTSTGPNLYPSEPHTTGGHLGFNANPTSDGSNMYPSEHQTAGGPLGSNGYSTSIAPNLYPSEQQTPSSGYYNMPVQYDGYNVQPQHLQPYYPQ